MVDRLRKIGLFLYSFHRAKATSGNLLAVPSLWMTFLIVFDSFTKIPVDVWYFRHYEPAAIRQYSTDVKKADLLHPVVYSAYTGHGSWYETGKVNACKIFVFCIYNYFADGGAYWRPWESPNGIQPVEMMPGYGFGGAWGAGGQTGNTTGPLGPSRYKDPLKEG